MQQQLSLYSEPVYVISLINMRMMWLSYLYSTMYAL